MITGRTHCKSVMCNGGVHFWRNDDREVPDHVTAGFEYPDHFHINYTAAFSTSHFRYGEQLLGSEGAMEIIGLRDLYVYPEKYRDAPEEVSSRPEIHIRGRKDLGQGNPTGAHLKNFIDAIRDNVPLNCDAQTGHEAAVTGHLATDVLPHREEGLLGQRQPALSFGLARRVTDGLSRFRRLRAPMQEQPIFDRLKRFASSIAPGVFLIGYVIGPAVSRRWPRPGPNTDYR